DTPAGRRKYLDYLAWLAEDEPARKKQRFAEMSKGWVIGGGEFAKAMVRENRELTGHGRRLAAEMQEAREGVWQEELARLLKSCAANRTRWPGPENQPTGSWRSPPR